MLFRSERVLHTHEVIGSSPIAPTIVRFPSTFGYANDFSKWSLGVEIGLSSACARCRTYYRGDFPGRSGSGRMTHDVEGCEGHLGYDDYD